MLWREKKIFQSFVDTIASALVICPFLLGHGWTKGIAAMCRFIKKQCKEKKTANKKKKKMEALSNYTGTDLTTLKKMVNAGTI